MSPDTLMMLARPISEEGGAGLFLKIVLVASVVGVALLAWLLLRAGRGNH